jgi:hypothetical protein
MLNQIDSRDIRNYMAKDTEPQVLVSLGTPLLARATRGFVPAQTTVAECIREVSRADPAERRVVQQIRREVEGVRFDILLVMQGGKIEKARPDQKLGEIAPPRDLQTPGGPVKQLVAQLELQSYAPVGDRP